MNYDSEGRLIISNAKEAKPIYEEDIVFLGVPVGRFSYGYRQLNWIDLNGVESIGRYCSLAPAISISGQHHPIDWVSTNPFLYRSDRGIITTNKLIPDELRARNKKIRIGNDVWIGNRATILRPCILGDGCVIAAGALVNRDVPPYAIVAGVPARIIRYRLPEELIQPMLEIAWWNWSLDKIRECVEDFYDPTEFVRKWQDHS
jgi:acetyltransferase-like isoleucine patch superfamily enzyme